MFIPQDGVWHLLPDTDDGGFIISERFYCGVPTWSVTEWA
jgi:hypothetical protein